MDKIIQLIEYIPTKPLSEILPSVLTLALESKDYKGYCVLSFFMYPMSPSAKTNNIHKNELIKILTLEGISKEDIITIVNESIEDYLEIKTVSEDAISSHSVKEIEIWLHNSKPLLDIDSNIVNKSYVDLSERKIQLEKMYEFMRSYTFSKLTYYQQFLGKSKNEPIKQEKIKAFIKAVPSKIFIVHGHNGELKESVARLIEKQGIHTIILQEQINQGDTIIEKFEHHSDVDCAICLFTADDFGHAKNDMTENKRARQNVVFEAGYFIGKLGRERVIIIADQGVEIPSDLCGVVYTNSSDWKISVMRELKALGFDIDFNKMYE